MDQKSNKKLNREWGQQLENRIDLINILGVIWKWKWLILVGTLTFAVIAAVISFQMKKVYRISTVLSPGIVRIEENGKKIYIDTVENVKAIIDSGTFDDELFKLIKSSNDVLPQHLNLRTNVQKGSDALKISYETYNIQLGIDILQLLSDRLLKKYIDIVDYYRNENGVLLQQKKSQIATLESQIKKYEKNIEQENKRIKELESEIKLINDNTVSIMKERNNFLSNKAYKGDITPALLYSNTIQQNLELSNSYKDDINGYSLKIEEYKHQLESAKNKIKEILEEIKYLEFKKSVIKNIQILQPPTSSPYPVKPKKALIIVLSTIIGLIIMLFFVFGIEFFKNVSTPSRK